MMAESGSSSKNFDGEKDSERITIQPYQFEPRRIQTKLTATQKKASLATKLTSKPLTPDCKIQTGMSA